MTSDQNTESRSLQIPRRKAISVPSQFDGVEEFSVASGSLPFAVRPVREGVDLTAWFLEHRELIERQLLTHGAVLFRGFQIDSLEKFDSLIHRCSEPMNYLERSSPRSQLAEQVYTSTNYPAERSIFPHNEHSYAATFPLRLFFCCEMPAQSGGETPLADCRKILRRLPHELQERFREKQWMYVRNFSTGIGLPWSTVFQTEDRQEVERHCVRSNIQFEWTSDGGLRTRQIRDAIARHPRTGELVWFNHATFFHVSTLEPSIRDSVLQQFRREDLPNNTYFGDGSEIDHTALETLRDAYLQERVFFQWQKGDLVVLDNMLTAHARMPFVGRRKILFAMAEPTPRSEVKA